MDLVLYHNLLLYHLLLYHLLLYHVLASITAQLLAFISRDATLLIIRDNRVFRVVTRFGVVTRAHTVFRHDDRVFRRDDRVFRVVQSPKTALV